MTDGLLLLHAFPLDATMWAPQVAAFGSAAPVVAPNVPGFGGDPSRMEVMSMDAAADRAAEAIDAAGVDRVVVCGLSMGGYVAFAFWRRHRDRVRGLVLAHTRAGADDEAGKQRRRDLAARLRSEGNGFLVENPPPLFSDDAPEPLWAQARAIIQAQPAEAIASASLGMAERLDSTGDLAEIDVPTLILTSTADALIPADASMPMADQIPGGVLEVLEGPGHISNLEVPEVFNRVLRDHLARCGLTQ